MNSSQKKDISYSFSNSCVKAVYTSIIDDEWRKEKFSDLDIVLPVVAINNKMNFDGFDEFDSVGRMGGEMKEWPDLGQTELIGTHTEQRGFALSGNQQSR